MLILAAHGEKSFLHLNRWKCKDRTRIIKTDARWQVDAFTSTMFKGNAAAVCLLPAWEDVQWMQQVASEFNLNMTAFLVQRESEGSDRILLDESRNNLNSSNYEIRTFTPLVEVVMCGHATLASAYLLFGAGIACEDEIHFHLTTGEILHALKVKTDSDNFLVELNLPVLPSFECEMELAELTNTFKDIKPVSWRKTVANDYVVELPSDEHVRSLNPCFDEIKKCNARGIIVTARASFNPAGVDCVSRFFAPKVGVDEDPVCGQAHCALAAFWAPRLNKNNLIAFQASKRSGTLYLRLDEKAGRVFLQGEATLVMSGVLFHRNKKIT